MNFGSKLTNFEPYTPFLYKGQIRLDANESPIDLPSEIKNEIAEKIVKTQFNRYPDPYATELCSAFGKMYNVSSEKIVAGNGSDELISVILSSLMKCGDTIYTKNPDFSMYNFYSDIFQLKQSTNFETADIVIFSNPCNPTGLGLEKKEVTNIIKNAKGIVIVDEAYMDFWTESVLDYIDEYDNLIILKTCSKNFGLAAARVGFAVSQKKNIDLIKTAKSPYNVNTLSQVTATTLLSHAEFLKRRTQLCIDMRKELYIHLLHLMKEDMLLTDTKTNFICIKTEKATEIYNKLLEKNIIIRCLSGNLLRITVGTPEETEIFIEAFKDITKGMKQK